MKILLATSGGIDSMTMAELMFSHSRILPLQCDEMALAHCNFHLREGDCDLDEALVKTWAEEHAVAFYRTDFDTEAFAKESGQSIEMAARELRYSWFAKLCLENGFDAVATAHHADDNAETLLLNLSRGTGMKGLCGMTQEDVLPYSDGKIRLVRPLLGLTREQIEAIAADRNIQYRTDLSNLENTYKRNRIRNGIIPQLKMLNPSVIETLNADMTRFRQASDILDLWYKEHSGIITDDCVSFDDLLKTEGWEYLLWRWLEPRGFNSATVDEICKKIRNGAQPGLSFSGREWELLTTSVGLRLTRTGARTPMDIYSSIIDWDESCIFSPESLYLDFEKIGAWKIRGWQDGDWFVPLGMKGRKKLSDWFTGQKMDLADKRETAVVVAEGWEEGHVAAVLGRKARRQDECTRVTELTRKVLELRASSEKK